jgi:hypothetical protein
MASSISTAFIRQSAARHDWHQQVPQKRNGGKAGRGAIFGFLNRERFQAHSYFAWGCFRYFDSRRASHAPMKGLGDRDVERRASCS